MKTPKPKQGALSLRAQDLISNAQTSKSGITLASCDAVLELAKLAGIKVSKKRRT